MESKDKAYLVYIDCPPHPMQGCRLDVITYRKGETFETIRDLIPSTVKTYIEVICSDIDTARMIGLEGIIRKIELSGVLSTIKVKEKEEAHG